MKKFSAFTLKTSIVCVVSVLLFNTCTKDKTPAPIEPCDPNKVYFGNDIQPLLTATCGKPDVGCHDPIAKSEGLDLTTYAGVMKIVKANNPGGSDIMEVINETKTDKIMPRPPYPPLTQEQKNLISQWISDGALNQTCTQDTGSCNPGVVSYSLQVSKILQDNFCLSCHSGSSLGGGFDLSSYAGVKACANTGKLYNSVAQNGQASAMPKGGKKISACDISKIKAWVDAGVLNN